MHLLIIGGTVFLGRHLVAEALRRGHQVTLFTRGRQNPDLFPAADRIVGDRRQDLDRIAGRRFDAVVDTCGYLPGDVAATAAALHPTVARYVFISSTTVYRDHSTAGTREDAATHPDPPGAVEVTGATLGALKAACERAVLDRYRSHACTLVRCGRIVGPYDVASRARVDVRGDVVTDVDYDAFAGRLPYWPLRAAAGDEFLAPEPADQPLQLLDARDLAQWLVGLAERDRTGAFNACGPVGTALTMADLIDASTRAAGVDPGNAVWVDEDFLLAHGVRPGTGLPLWTPRGALRRRGHYQMDLTAATLAGLHTRPIFETVRDILAWARRHPAEAVAATSPVLDRERERDLLALWRKQNAG